MAPPSSELIGDAECRYLFKQLIQERPHLGRVWKRPPRSHAYQTQLPAEYGEPSTEFHTISPNDPVADRTSVEETMAMQLTRKAGMPVPKVLCCGEHPASFNRSFSILMTRLPGLSLENSYHPFEVDVEGPWIDELKTCLQSMRLWQGPENRIYSAIGTSIRSLRVPGHVMGPFKNEAELHEYLLGPASMHGFKSTEEYEETLLRARKIQQQRHRITFTHGDFKAHNILVDDGGHLSGFLDWESAGWYPEYWEFTTAMRFGKNSWWYQLASWMGGDRYLEDLDSDVALNLLTVDSYIAWWLQSMIIALCIFLICIILESSH